MSIPTTLPSAHLRYVRPGFCWDRADAYLFDIDGTLLNCRDSVHSRAFHHAFQDILGVAASLNGLVLHGNTDIGILRGALRREGIPDTLIDSRMNAIVERMCAQVLQEREQLEPEICPSIRELLSYLRERGKLLGVASGNLGPIGWTKLGRAGLRKAFSFGSFAWPRESRVEVFREGVTLAQERLGRAANVCVVGDTPADIQAAKAAGLPVIALATGIYDFSALRSHDPDVCCGSATDLLALR